MIDLPNITKDIRFIKNLKEFKINDKIFNSNIIEAIIESKWE
jgi:hypothetical protein